MKFPSLEAMYWLHTPSKHSFLIEYTGVHERISFTEDTHTHILPGLTTSDSVRIYFSIRRSTRFFPNGSRPFKLLPKSFRCLFRRPSWRAEFRFDLLTYQPWNVPTFYSLHHVPRIRQNPARGHVSILNAIVKSRRFTTPLRKCYLFNQ
jgi:hypothetical protein